jgi:hypothetical protein
MVGSSDQGSFCCWPHPSADHRHRRPCSELSTGVHHNVHRGHIRALDDPLRPAQTRSCGPAGIAPSRLAEFGMTAGPCSSSRIAVPETRSAHFTGCGGHRVPRVCSGEQRARDGDRVHAEQRRRCDEMKQANAEGGTEVVVGVSRLVRGVFFHWVSGWCKNRCPVSRRATVRARSGRRGSRVARRDRRQR